MNWYDRYVRNGRLDSMVYQRGYKVGAALALGLAPNAFCGISWDDWGDFFSDWKANTGEPHLPYCDDARQYCTE